MIGRGVLMTVLLLGATALQGYADIGVDAAADGNTPSVPDDATKSTAERSIPSVPDDATNYEFQAEVNRLMDIIINSLYSNRDIFLRELISNASDALDKIRIMMLTDRSLQTEGEDDSELKVHISADAEAGTLTIRDWGVGMTREELVQNLGTVARSGTSKFVEAAKSGGDDTIGLIGQFGVGFYSAFLVADRVTVTTKHVNDTQQVWVSDAKSSFQVYEDTSNSLGRHGSAVTLYLKDDAKEYLTDSKLRDIVVKYSEFVNFPIYLYASKTVSEEVSVEEEDAEDTTADETATSEKASGDDELEAVEEKEEKAPGTKTVEKTVFEWELVNKNKPIWTRSADSITDDEYNSFFKAISKSDDDPLSRAHFSAEGNSVKFRALLYIPSKAPYDLYDRYYSGENDALKLYVRRVLLAEKMDKTFLPQYLNFIKGVVDSDDLPINVSRETLQKSRILKLIGRKITKKALRMLEDMAAETPDEGEEEEAAEGEEETPKEKADEGEKKTTYEKFWGEFARSVKLGVLEDERNKDKLVKLLRFTSTKSPQKLVSLEQYVERMSEKQQHIYYISGPDQASVENSPMLEQLHKRQYEVLYFVDNLDEYLVQTVREFEGKEFMSVTKEGLEFGDETDDQKEIQKELESEFKSTIEWMKTALGDKVGKVVMSRRVYETPAVLVSTRWGWSANMERIMRAQAMSQQFENQKFMIGTRTLEINPDHMIIQEIKHRIDRGETEGLDDVVNLLYDSALINSGFSHEHVSDFAKRISNIMASNLNVENKVSPLEITPKPKVDDSEDDGGDEEQEEEEEENDGERDEL